GALHTLEAIVSACAAPGAKAITSERKCDLVHDDQKICRGRPKRPAYVGPQDGAAQIHVRLRFQKADLRASDISGRYACLAVPFPAVETPNVGEVVDNPPADVVSR